MFLRGWGEYQPYGLKLTESELPGLGHTGLRAWSPEALERRVAAIEATGLGDRLERRRPRARPRVRVPRSRRPPVRAVLRAGALRAARAAAPAAQERASAPCRPRRVGQADRSRERARAPTSRRTGGSPTSVLGFRTYEQVVNDDGIEAGAWMSLTIAAHELIYTADHAGGSGRLHHLAWFVDTREELLRAADLFLDADVPIEAAPSKHAVAQGMFLYVYEPGGNRVEVTTGTHFIFDPAYRAGDLDPGRARPRAGVGGQDDRDLPHLRDAGPQREAARPADPADEPGADALPYRARVSDDRLLIRELVENWVVWRDAGDWDRFATVWHDDGFMMATWFQGPAADFIRVSREGFERGVNILHFLGGNSVDVAGDRAISQTKMTISQRADVHGVVVRRGLHRSVLRLPRAARRAVGDRAAPADLREGSPRSGRPRGHGLARSGFARRLPGRVPPPRVRADTDRIRRQARHARPGRSRRRARSTAAAPSGSPAGRSATR